MSIDRFLHPAVLQPGFLFYVRLAALVFALSFKTVTGQAVLNPDLPLQISNLEVQLLSNGRTAITWQTNKSSQAEVSYGLQGLETTISSDGWYKDEAVILADLLPDRLYHYKVVVQTATGEQAASPHLLFWSHHQADLAVADLNWLPEAISYQGYKPNLSDNTLTLNVTNQGQIDIANDFYVSLLLSDINQGTEATSPSLASGPRYSCFGEVKVSGGLPAGQVRQVTVDDNVWEQCDNLDDPDYRLTVAVDYNSDIEEANELNNVAWVNLATASSSSAVINDLTFNDLTPDAVIIDFELPPELAGRPVTMEYARDADFDLNPEQPYSWWQDVIWQDGQYQASLKGLEQQSKYHLRLLIGGTNLESDDLTFETPKDPDADLNDLLSLKRLDPNCRLLQAEPQGGNYWRQQSLTVPEQSIVKYRIQWQSGGWSPWYQPGQGDIDWVVNSDGSQRRVWSYFDDHQFEYLTCASGSGLPKDSGSKNYKLKTVPQVLGVERY